MSKSLNDRFEDIEYLSRKMGLDPFPIIFEEVPRETIWDVSSYGLPTRMSHWSFGRSYIHQKTYGEMGFSKIYELIINNNPSYAFLDNTNPDIVNIFVAAHCFAHSDFFKNNSCFAKTNRNMVNMAEQNANTIERLQSEFGLETVEKWMDAAFSIDSHIDPVLGEFRERYPDPKYIFKTRNPIPFSDLFGESSTPTIKQEIINNKIPPFKEKDLLWFIINYSPISMAQKEVFGMIRSESFYFYPQFLTKIMNEGWASFWHAEIMLNYEDITPSEHLDFVRHHSGVVNPGRRGSFNPYYVGFMIFSDVKKRWDKYFEDGKKDKAFQNMDVIDFYDNKGKVMLSKINGFQKMFKIRSEDDDISFINNYLTKELFEELKLFTFGYKGVSQNLDHDDIILKDRNLESVIKTITDKLHNYGVPLIWVEKVENDQTLLLKHSEEELPLDEKYALETLKYIRNMWNRPVKLLSHNRFGVPVCYTCIEEKSVTLGEDGYNGKVVKVTI